MESHLHRMAKELLYNEIINNKRFECKDHLNKVYFKEINKWNAVLMEMPYYDDCYKRYTPFDVCYKHDGWGLCDGWGACTEDMSCSAGFKDNNGISTCHKCNLMQHKKGMKYFDIAIVVLDGNGVYWIDSIIEIVNTHYPEWEKDILDNTADVYIIKAEDILKRVSDSPVYVERYIRIWVRSVNKQIEERDRKYEMQCKEFGLLDDSIHNQTSPCSCIISK